MNEEIDWERKEKFKNDDKHKNSRKTELLKNISLTVLVTNRISLHKKSTEPYFPLLLNKSNPFYN